MGVQELPRDLQFLEHQVDERRRLLAPEELWALSETLPRPRDLAEALLALSNRPVTYILPSEIGARWSHLADTLLVGPEDLSVLSSLKASTASPTIAFWPIIDEYEVWEARCLELDGVVIDPKFHQLPKLQYLIETCKEASIQAVLQIKSQQDFDLALETDAKFLLIYQDGIDLSSAAEKLRRWGRGRLAIAALEKSNLMDVGKLRGFGYNCFYLNAKGDLPHELIAEKSLALTKRSPHERRSALQRFWR